MNYKSPIKNINLSFPYRPPTKQTRIKYKYIFNKNFSLKEKRLKLFFDKFFSIILLIIFSPILFLIVISYYIEGLIVKDNNGPVFFSYKAVSKGSIFLKYKIRLIKTKYINVEKAKRGEWSAYAAEWDDDALTFTGRFVKKFYLDEIPQFINILKGDMSIVGPRPLCVMHYRRDLLQGNVSRKILKGGLLGLGHIHKGTKNFGDPIFEYEYIHKYNSTSGIQLLFFDLLIIFKGAKLILKGGGH
jgi:lipopolysaccharide/colanic/teichoic acid biosynthesis glycosyltransferase